MAEPHDRDTRVLVIGAGPFGLSLAAYLGHLGIDYLVVGEAMGFWRRNMPEGMYLRSGLDWHLDPLGVHTIDAYLRSLPAPPSEPEPLSRDLYLNYAEWFRQQRSITPSPAWIVGLDRDGDRFVATDDKGASIRADAVVVAVGFQYFESEPREVVSVLPPGRYAHTCDLVELEQLRGQRVLIVGGRQSALEWAALACEAGAAMVHVSHRHDTPAFARSDWSWVQPLVDAMVANPGWYRNLDKAQQEQVSQRLWAEGRLKLEPWLGPRVARSNVRLWPRTAVSAAEVVPRGEVRVSLDSGDAFSVDRLILATGYKVDIARVPFLAVGNVLPQLAVRNGFPVLDEHFQTSVPGLYVTSIAATQDFGPFFGFTVAVRTSARLIGDHLAARGGE
jgi:FAD-dependent urate hydroxylase